MSDAKPDVEDLRAVVADLIAAVHDLQTRLSQLDHQDNMWPADGERFAENRQVLES